MARTEMNRILSEVAELGSVLTFVAMVLVWADALGPV